MNLHITGDDKFIDFFITDIEKLGLVASNDFLVYTVGGRPLKYVKSERIQKITLNSSEWEVFFKESVQKYDRIFIHYFDGVLFHIVKYIPVTTKVIWCFYGNDGFLYFPENYFLQKLTWRLSKRITSRNKEIIFKMFYPLYLLNRKLFLLKRQGIMKAAFRRVDYFANYLVTDYELIKERMGLNFKHIEVTLTSLETMISMESDRMNNEAIFHGASILIGNSATNTNNHPDIFERLGKLDMAGRKIYCPLSYGNDNYAGIIEAAGKEKFGKDFIPLRDFMPLDKYNSILKDCGYVFMNHDRTQGASNVIVSLYNGAKVFLSNKSGLYHFLKKLGVKVFSVQDDINAEGNIFIPLAKEDILRNRKLIYDYYNEQKHEKRLLEVLNV